MNNQNQLILTNDHYAKIEVEIAGKRFVGSINMANLPVNAIVDLHQLPYPLYIGTNKVVAVDFDGTLFEDAYPNIGTPHHAAIEYVKKIKAAGNEVILWTCRCGWYLDIAVAACASYGLAFDAINDNVPRMKELYGNDSRKVFADLYLDEKSLSFEAIMRTGVLDVHPSATQSPVDTTGKFEKYPIDGKENETKKEINHGKQ